MIKPRSRLIATMSLLHLATVGCEPVPRAGSLFPSLDTLPLWDFQTYVGNGFTLRLPSDARLSREALSPSQLTHDAVGSVLTIRGPDLHLRATEADAEPWGPTYELVLAEYEKSAAQSLEEFVWRHAEADAHVAGRSAAELARLATRFHLPVVDTIAGQVAVWFMPLCADCWIYRLYFERANRVIAIAFTIEDLYNQRDPLLPMQRMLYAYVLQRFRWRPL